MENRGRQMARRLNAYHHFHFGAMGLIPGHGCQQSDFTSISSLVIMHDTRATNTELNVFIAAKI